METNINELLEQNGFENDVNTSKSKKRKLLVIILGSIVALVLVSVCVLAATKSNEEKFMELLIEKQSAVDFIKDNFSSLEKMACTIEVDIDELEEQLGDSGVDGVVKFDSAYVTKNDDIYGVTDIYWDDDEIIKLEFGKTGQIYGARLNESDEKFIAVENKNLNDLLEKFDLEDEITLPDEIDTSFNYKDIIKMDENDLKGIGRKYGKIVVKSLDGKVEVEKDEKLKIGGQDLKTKKYTLKLTEKDLFDVTFAVMKELKDDKKNVRMVLDDFKAIVEYMEENDMDVDISSRDIPDIDEVMQEIEDLFKELEEVDVEYIDDEEIVFELCLYENKGKTVANKLFIEGGYYDTEIMFKCIADKDVYIALEMEEYNEEVAMIIKGKKEKDLKLDFIIEVDKEKIKLFTYTLKNPKNIDIEFVELNEENTLVMNDESVEKIEEYILDAAETMEDLAEIIDM